MPRDKSTSPPRTASTPSKQAPEPPARAPAEINASNAAVEADDGSAPSSVARLFHAIGLPLLLLVSLFAAVYIRLEAPRKYGNVIHEFDPWFNYRATKYLVDNGWEKFSNWYDYECWYPLGRPVGHTIYPGLMVTAAGIFHAAEAAGQGWSLNDVCVFLPAAFSVVTCLAVYGLAYETSDGNRAAATAACFIMAIMPAHLMRSVAGGYDNECVAVAAIVVTFWLWVRAVKSPRFCWLWATLCGFCYVYLVSAWGAYIFALNMIGVHVGVAVLLLGRFSLRVYVAYSVFYVIGTVGALQFPVVGWQPLQAMEQMGPMAVFLALQVLAMAELWVRWNKTGPEDAFVIRLLFLVGAGLAGACAVNAFVPAGFFGPLSARVRGLFVRHTKTGNPLVDSVAEHQATPSRVYWLYFHCTLYLTPAGFVLLWNRVTAALKDTAPNVRSCVDGIIFHLCMTAVTYYFSSKMIRLVLLFSPAAAISAGIASTELITWAIPKSMEEDAQTTATAKGGASSATASAAGTAATGSSSSAGGASGSTRAVSGGRMRRRRNKNTQSGTGTSGSKDDAGTRERRQREDEQSAYEIIKQEWDANPGFQRGVALCSLVLGWLCLMSFVQHSRQMSMHLSEPQIMTRIRETNEDGEPIGVKVADDFREAYWWLRDNTPENARVLAWWDYGYQINGIAERTTLADGNTWNHEHIALVGKMLVSPEQQSHAIARHLADYVLVWTTRWAGQMGDDLAKSPHMARIAGSVYADVNATDFRFVDRDGTPSATMRASMLFQLHSYGMDPDVSEPQFFEEAYTTSNKMVRVYKIKDVDEASRTYCDEHHAYPPALDSVLGQAKAFRL